SSDERFVGKDAAHASILAASRIAITVKADRTHSGDGRRAGWQDQSSGSCEAESASGSGAGAGGMQACCKKQEEADGCESFCRFHDYLLSGRYCRAAPSRSHLYLALSAEVMRQE